MRPLAVSEGPRLLPPGHFSLLLRFATTLPPEWSSFVSLHRLDGSSNLLTGTLPAGWQALASLSELDLSSNSLTSTLPSAWEAGMAQMTRLVLTGNAGM